MNRIYILQGEPKIYKRMCKDKQWTTQQQEHLTAAISLSSQLNYDDPICKPCKLSIKFYTKRFGTQIDKILKFVMSIARGLIFTHDCNIFHLDVKKIQDDEPRTIITLKVKDI